jgi:acyl transferase domain-containing protein
MGRELLEKEPVFRASIERVDAEFQRHASWSLMDALTASEEASLMGEAEVAQPANFALQVALDALLASWGIRPEAYIGHSAGEIAAHYLAGALSFEDAVCIIYHRSRLQQRTSGQGRMLAVGMTTETLNQAVNDAGSGVSIAAINSPSAITLVGEAAILEDMARQLETFQVFHRFLNGKVPYHSHFMEPLREELLESLADLHPQRATMPLYSTVTGTRIDGRGVDAAYWWQNVRATVLFGSAISQMIQDGYNVFLELSPHPVLASAIKELLAQQEQEGTVLPTLRRKEAERVNLLSSLGSLYTLGFPIAWRTLVGSDRKLVKLPLYPWQLKSYWTESVESRDDRLLTLLHPLLGQRMSPAHPTWELELSSRLLPYLADHRIQGNVLLPGAAYAEIALAAAHEVFSDGEYTLEGLTFKKALFLPDTSDPKVQTVLNPQEATVEVYSYTPTGEARWTLHATARLRRHQPSKLLRYEELKASFAEHCTGRMSRSEFYQQTQAMGFQYGPAFQTIEEIQLGNSMSISKLRVPASLEGELSSYFFHPSLMDAAFQTLLVAARPTETTEGQHTPYLPISVDRIRILGRPTFEMQAFARIIRADDRLVVGDVQVVDLEGNLLAEIEGFRAQSLEASMSLAPERIDRGLYELEWYLQERTASNTEEAGLASGVSAGESVTQNAPWLIFADQQGLGQALLASLEAHGQRAVSVAHGDVADLANQDGQYTLNPALPEQFTRLFADLAASGQQTFSRIVYLWGLDTTFSEQSTLAALEADQPLVTLSVVHLIKALSQCGWTQLPTVWLVTQGAQPVGELTGRLAIEQALLWGLGRVIGHQEFTSLWGGLIDLDYSPVAGQAEKLFEEISQTDGEDQVAFRADQRYVVRLVQSQHLTPPLPPTFQPDGSYLVTGGLGTLGLLVARWMASQGARRVILMGRTPVPPRSAWYQLEAGHPQKRLVQELLQLESMGTSIHLAAVDVADEEQLANFLNDYKRDGWPTIKGVVHTAGVVEDELLLRMSTETFTRVLRPKLRGGWLLHSLLKDYPLDFFMLFSSTGSVIASLGQANYASANAFLDALAEYRRAQGLPALSIGWGPWSVGMVEQLKLEQFYTRRGIELITPEVGMQIMSRVTHQTPAHLVAISANWAVTRESAPQSSLPPMFLLLGEQESEVETTSSTRDNELLERLAATEAASRSSLLESYLQEMIARVLQLESTQFSTQEALTSLGMDSMMAIEVKNRISGSVKVDVPVLELLQGVTIAQLAARILASLQFAEGTPASDGTAEEASTAPAEEIEQLLALADNDELERLLAELEQSSAEQDLEVRN